MCRSDRLQIGSANCDRRTADSNCRDRRSQLSGSNGSGWDSQPTDNCAALSETTSLNSPDSSVISGLKKGDLLDVVVQKLNGVVLVRALRNGKVAGSITSAIIQRLADCVENGYVYVAEVLEDAKGAVCKVRVRVK